jgi:glucosamine-6-phosphate deaminase
MKRFKGSIMYQVLSKEDLNKLLTIPIEEINDWSPVRVVVKEDLDELYYTFARSIADKIKNNNKNNLPSRFIFPVGPTTQYPILVEICNKERISWKNVWTFNMDEYLDWEGRPISKKDIMSFEGFMDKNLFGKLDKELSIPKDHKWFPDPFNPEVIEEKIRKIGGIDICYGGIGFHGHIAFNEPINTYFTRLTPEEFKNSKTRVLDLNPDTFVINSFRSGGGNPYSVPPKAVTLGMKVILESRTIELYCDGGTWQQATFRIACMHPPTMDRPVTYIQEHKNPKETVKIFADRETALPLKSTNK